MEIRSITTFCDPRETALADLYPFFQAAQSSFAYPVQSLRLATPPFPDWWRSEPIAAQAQALVAAWEAVGVRYISLGPVQLRHDSDWLELIPALLNVTDSLFATVEIADQQGTIDTDRCGQVAQLIRRISKLRDDGFGNLYFAALANCPPGSPFFPVAYHAGGAPQFAIAVEAADLALQAIQGSHSLDEARQALIAAIETAASNLTETAVHLAHTHHLTFAGIDFSLAPFPTADKSLGGALEAVGVPHVGAAGSLFAAAFITDAIERAHFPRCGFSGLMLPVLEDAVLAQRAAERRLSLTELLSASAVCGVGLDTIPLPGDVSAAQLTAILLDVAALATRLNKPLTARLMPLPGLDAGDPVQFDFPYFADSRVMAIAGSGVQGPLQTPTRLPLGVIRGHG